MRGSTPVVVLVAMFAVARVAAGCEEDFEECYAGDFVACTCADGKSGYAACSSRGDYAASPCVCDGTTPGIDAGPRDAAPDTTPEVALDAGVCIPDAGDSGPTKLFEPCTTPDECEGCRCEGFGTRQLCTQTCTTDEECPAPSDMCTNRGVCRPPQ